MSGGTVVPELVETPVEDVSKGVAELKNTFYEGKTRPVEFRLVQLRKLYWAYVLPSSFKFSYKES